MPLYFFDFTDGEFKGRDEYGIDLPDMDSAAREAVGALANISKDALTYNRNRVLEVNVRTQSGETVLTTAFTLAVTRFPSKQSRYDQIELAGPTQIPAAAVLSKQR